MSTVLTQYQIPEKSILDLWGRQTYLGNAFVLPQNGHALGDTNEHSIALLRNPSTNTKSLFLTRNQVNSSTTDAITFRYYLGPTPNVVGATTAPINLKTGSATTSVINAYLSATITANGTLLTAFIGTQNFGFYDPLIILDPGKDFLITAQASANTPTAFSQLFWYEL